MQIAKSFVLKPSATTVLLLMVGAFSSPMQGQQSPAVHVGNAKITGLADDWTHHHLVFSNPGTQEDAVKNGTYDQWSKIVTEPRYVLQQLKKGLPAQGPSSQEVDIRNFESRRLRGSGWKPFVPDFKKKSPAGELHKDWSMATGATGALLVNSYPAKYDFTTNSGSCSDYVVYPTGLLGSATQPTLISYTNIYGGGTCTSATGPSVQWAYNTGGTTGLSPILSADGSQIAYVQSVGTTASLVFLKWAPGPTANATVTATLNSTVNFTLTVGTLSAADVGAPISGTGIPGNDYIATVTSATTGTLTTAATGTGSQTLTIHTETNVLPGLPTSVTNANYRTCAAPCYTTIALNGTHNDTNSSPFNIYYGTGADTMFVGDDSGNLHKFTGGFEGTPAETVGTGWPTPLGTTKVTSPVYDPVSTDVFAADAGGKLYRVNTTGTAAAIASATLSHAGSTGIVDAPLVDSTPATPVVYVFVGDSAASTALVEKFPTNFLAAAAATTTYLVSSGTGSATTVTLYDGDFDNIHYTGNGTTGNMYVCGVHTTGTASRLYQIAVATGTVTTASTADPSTAANCSPVTEFLGTKSATTITATMTAGQTTATLASGAGEANSDYIQIDSEIIKLATTGGGVGTVNLTGLTRGALGTTATTHTSGAVVTDIQDWLFLSVASGGTGGGTPACTGACLYNYNVTGGFPSGTAIASATAGIAATGGTTGIIIDNNSLTTGESQIYYSTRGNQVCNGNGTTGTGTANCAVQTLQSVP